MPQQPELSSKTRFFKTYQVFIPIAIGLIAIAALFLHEFDIDSFRTIRFDGRSIIFIFLAFLLIAGRDVGMMARLRLLTNYQLTWKQAFNVNILKEFSAAIMPAAIGAGPALIILLTKEGINAGKSTTIGITNLFLDNLFYVVFCPLIFLFVPLSKLFSDANVVSSTIQVVFWVVYPLLCGWTFILFFGLFIRPDLLARALRYLFKLRFLRRWQPLIYSFTENMLAASKEIKQRPFVFWLKTFGVTIFAWSCRFFVANALLMAFTNIGNQLVVFGRQLIIWLSMIVVPTPGGSGLSEIAFKEFYSDIMLGSGPMLIVITMWRILSYYLYLFLGVIVFPQWAKKAFPKKSKQSDGELVDSKIEAALAEREPLEIL